ncbi:CAP domain-containing protein [Cohnella silvisoli]|uniref:CAP domain-containing protein n=1 Tax=Cohnella silvisoli TaxID=2873699 RepID=A0ABV1KQE2_9BACL|nr:CAP domain-containing protein [Cohnella silvisoli]MCD9022063.1 LysM peptidoglycan-binding domain-containing protein [Cohnella silvisoli]
MKRLVMILILVLLAACGKQNTPMKAQSLTRLSSVDTTLPANQHVVQKNETIRDIADRYHVSIDELLKLNPNLGQNISANPEGSADVPIQPNQTVTLPANQSLDGYEAQVLSLTNQERQKAGLSPCAGNDSNLNRSARAKSEDMAAHNYFSHESPTYGDPFVMMRNFGVQYQSAGENIAKGQPTPQEVVTAWMNSPGHRKNIMNGSYTHLGVGYVLKNGEAYWTQQFIGK